MGSGCTTSVTQDRDNAPHFVRGYDEGRLSLLTEVGDAANGQLAMVNARVRWPKVTSGFPRSPTRVPSKISSRSRNGQRHAGLAVWWV